MPPVCFKCGSKMKVEQPYYICKSCGLTVNKYDFNRLRRENSTKKNRNNKMDKRDIQDNYLKWYLSSDKENFEED